jgi:hypothetical protein
MIREKYELYKKYVEGTENIAYQVMLIYKALCEIHKQLKELDPVEYERASKTWLAQIDTALENRDGILTSPDNLLKTFEAIERRLEIKVKEFEEERR